MAATPQSHAAQARVIIRTYRYVFEHLPAEVDGLEAVLTSDQVAEILTAAEVLVAHTTALEAILEANMIETRATLATLQRSSEELIAAAADQAAAHADLATAVRAIAGDAEHQEPDPAPVDGMNRWRLP